jgi:hypothetical protein
MIDSAGRKIGARANNGGGKDKRRDYEPEVGKVVDGFTIVSLQKDRHATFTVQCKDGHRFPRPAWDVVTRGIRRCPVCTHRTGAITRAHRRGPVGIRLSLAPEVCDCTFFNGVLKRACSQHRSAA